MLTAGMLLCIVCVLLVYLVIRSNRRPKNYPPGPFNLPVVGYLPFVDSDTMHLSCTELSKKYGDIFSLKFGSVPVVVLSSWEGIKHALSMPEVSGRPHVFSFEFFGDGHYGIISSEGPFWKDQRRFVLRHLRDLGMGKSQIEEAVKDEILVMMNGFQEHLGQITDISFQLNIAVTNIVWQIIAGKRMNHDDPYFLRVMEAVNKNVTLSLRAGILNFIPFLASILPEKTFGVDHMKYWRNWFWGWSKDIVRDHQDTYDEDNMRDFIDMYIREMRKESADKSTFSEWQLLQIIGDFFVAGGETTSTTLRWSILYLAKWPEIQAKIHEELDDVVGTSRMPTLSDRTSLPYTEAVIHEIQRFCDLAPTGVMHATLEDCTLMGYTIPKDTVILANLHKCHRDPSVWEHPYKFYPEHFLDKEGNFRERKEAYMPFSVGKRQCPGESLAKLELFLFLTCFLQKFTFRLPEGADASIKPKKDTGFIQQPRPYHVVIEARES